MFFGLEGKDFVPIVISIVALLFTALQYFGEYQRKKKQDTLEAYNELQNDVFTPLNKLREEYPKLPTCSDFEKQSEITGYLAKIERFCVGVNLKIYDKKTLKCCGGAYFIRQYLYLKELIKVKRESNNGGKHYDEFEKVVKKLRKKYYKKEYDNILKQFSDNTQTMDETVKNLEKTDIDE